MAAGSDRKLGVSASTYHDAKVVKYGGAQASASLPFEYLPVVLESTGGFGERAVAWWKQVCALDVAINAPVSGVSPVLSPDKYTWSAQRFSSYWLQRISLALALAYVTYSDAKLTTCAGFGAEPG